MEQKSLKKGQQFQQVRRWLDFAARRKMLLISCLLLSLAAGLFVYLQMPKIYSCTALLSYEKQKVNPAKMSPDNEERITSVVSTLAEIVLSRSSLEKIIVDEKLYKEERENLPMEDVVAKMRRNISIDPSRQGDILKVTFTGLIPNEVVRVTNSLAARFIEENVKYREERATETSAYTKSELEMAKGMLDQKEAVMRDYKLKYYNEMPDQRAANTARLISLQEQYQNRQSSIQDLERTAILVRDQIAMRKQVLENIPDGYVKIPPADQPRSRIETDIDKRARLLSELRSLEGRYKEEHPKVKSLKRELARLEETTPVEIKADLAAPEGDGKKEYVQPDKTLQDLQAQLNNISLGIKKIEQEKEEIEKLIKQYDQWVANVPVREAEWSALTREYSQLKSHYDTIVALDLQAGSALNLERKEKGSQFKVVDPARRPVKPIKPDFLKMMVLCLIIGCAFGGGIAISMEMLDTSFRDPVQLEEMIGVEVICSVPRLSLVKETTRKRIWTALGATFIVALATALAIAFIFFWKQGRIIF